MAAPAARFAARSGVTRAREAEPGREEDLAVRERTRTRRPPMYRVLLHNDDYTSMDFVIDVLVRYFEKTATEATRIMLLVHHAGVGVAGIYTRDEAETRVERVVTAAKAEGYPLLLTTEPD
ncbi:MAG TPA: ATP-dependent Clp protease adaptor ClpS [Longimicrobium sp.]|nr:ATP-dependent Clp protease adaptor ClpS [Longimicrobium sp.]